MLAELAAHLPEGLDAKATASFLQECVADMVARNEAPTLDNFQAAATRRRMRQLELALEISQGHHTELVDNLGSIVYHRIREGVESGEIKFTEKPLGSLPVWHPKA